MIAKPAWGWDELRKALCSLRRECKARVAVPDPFWPGQMGGLQLQATTTNIGLSQSTKVLGTDPRRIGVTFTITSSGTQLWINPGGDADSTNNWMFSLLASWASRDIMPPDFGILPQYDWYVYATGFGARVHTIEYLRV